MIENKTNRLLLYAGWFILFTYCLRSLTEPDIWWQLRAGSWIWENGKVPVQDVLSYTFNGEPWTNVKWLSECLYFIIATISNPVMINLLCGFVYVSIGLLVYKRCSKQFDEQTIMITTLLFAFVCSYRMNGRPEMFSYLFTALYLNTFHRAQKQFHWLWMLIPIQILWSNMHEAFAIGVLLSLVYAAFQLGQGQVNKRWISLWALCMIGAVAVNPRGLHLYTYALNIYGQLQTNSFTQEMSGWGEELYWNVFTKLYWLAGLLVGLRMLFLWKEKGKGMFEYVASYELVTMLLFFYLGVKSNRNIVFFQIACFPFLAKTLADWLPTFILKNKTALLFLLALNYVFIVSNLYYEWLHPNNQFGISIHPEKTPIGAFEYLKKQDKHSKIFADVMSTNYGMWALRPTYKSYIDLRDLDVFPSSFFKNCYTLYQQPDIPLKGGGNLWQLADSLDKFDFVLLLNNENFSGLQRYLRQANSGYKMAYADPLNTVYVSDRKKGVAADTTFHPYYFSPNSYSMINKIFNPFWKNIEDRDYPYAEMETMWREL